jgi:transposase
MAKKTAEVIGGVDTHKNNHYAAAIDSHGKLLGHREFPANEGGYAALLEWMRGHGQLAAIGVESTGNFGVSLTRHLTAAGEEVVEVNRPNRQARHMDGKSDRLDSEQIARSVLAETGTAAPKSKSGPVEVIRMLRVARASAVRARTQAFNNLFGTMVSAPSPVRDQLVELTRRTFVNHCLALEPERRHTPAWLSLSPRYGHRRRIDCGRRRR